jgi:hypothetical protein
LPILGNDDKTANFNYVKTFVLNFDEDFDKNKKLGEKYGMKYAEVFHYMTDIKLPGELSPMDEFIKRISYRYNSGHPISYISIN